MEQVFTPLPSVPDHPRLEEEILQWWEDEGIFEQVRDRNRGGPKWSFIDGPVTANKKLGVHTAWGRTLKDVFQRYKALRGFDQRYQNGFDCQGLWIEVGVERQLGLNSKREIEEYGLEKFAGKCRDVVVRYAGDLTRASKRLGQWMDWGNDYFTFSDTNIEYIWRFLKIVDERGWLYLGHRSTGGIGAPSTTCRPPSGSSTGSWRGTRSRSTKEPASSTSRPARDRRTSTSAGVKDCRC